MLFELCIDNFLLIDHLKLEFHAGLNVITGETGAGKSIILTAIQLGLGGKTDDSVLKNKKKPCHIYLLFDLEKLPLAQKILHENHFDYENPCIVHRIIDTQGRSKITINDRPCSQQLMRQLSALLMNFHHQNDQNSLTLQKKQQALLDHFAQHTELLTNIKEIYAQWKKLGAQQKSLEEQAKNSESQLDFNRFLLQELQSAKLIPNEWEDLSKKHKNFHHNKTLLQQLEDGLFLMQGKEHGVLKQLQNILSKLKCANTENKLQSSVNLIHDASIQVTEAAKDIEIFIKNLDLSTEHFQNIEERLSLLHTLSRKHQCQPNALHEKQLEIENKMIALNNITDRLQKIKKEQDAILNQYQIISAQLSASRQKNAAHLEQLMTEKMQQLGMPKGQFKINLLPVDAINEYGKEKIEFLMCVNPGHPFATLEKAASGGELSRLSLAFEVIAQETNNTPTLIFDEIDSGIGGATAQTVGALLKQIGQNTQVLCITHLAQVAGYATCHINVTKEFSNQQTHLNIKILNPAEKILELARMISGNEISAEALEYSKTLLNDA